MTDDQTRPIETPAAPEQAADPVAPATTASSEGDTVAGASVPVAPVAPGSNRARWIIGLGVAGIAIAATVGALLLLSRPSTPAALSYIPGDAPFVAELRLDLPGDQTQRLGNLLAHFPGFADQSTLTDKIDEALSRLVEMGGPRTGVDYRTDIKPWLNGALFVGMLPPAGGLDAAGPEQLVISATTDGTVNCAATFEGQTVTHETYRGLDLVLSPDSQFACVLDGRQALVGEPATVRKALDAKADGSGMNQRPEYGAARTALGGDRLATIYVNGTALQALMPTPSILEGPVGLPAFLTPSLPAWMIAGVRAEDDALVIDAVTGPIPAPTAGPSLLPMPAGHASLIAPMLPADTLAYIEIQGAGVGLQNLLTQLREVPELAAPLAMLDGLGGGSGLVSWIDDVGLAVSAQGLTPTAISPEIARVLIAKDEATASMTVSSLDTMLGLAGLGGGLEVTEETINGVQVTTVTITDLGALVPPGSVPGLEVPPMDGPLSFSVAARGRAVILTLGDGAMASVVNATGATSLAESAAFKQAAARGIASSQSTMYIAAGAAIDLVRGFMPPTELARFNTEVAPYLDPLAGVLITGSSDATGARSRVVINVATP